MLLSFHLLQLRRDRTNRANLWDRHELTLREYIRDQSQYDLLSKLYHRKDFVIVGGVWGEAT